MTTTNPTIHDRVRQAIARDAELLDGLKALDAARTAAKEAEDGVRKSAAFTDAQAALQTEYDVAVAKAKAIYDAAIAVGRKPLVAAQKTFDGKQLIAQGQYQKVEDAVRADRDGKLAQAKRDREEQVAAAAAAVYRATREMESHKTTISQHRRNVKEQLNLDLNKLLEI